MTFGNLIGLTASILCSSRGKSRLSILIYHRVLSEPDPLRATEPTVAVFDWQMRLLHTYFEPLALSDALDRLKNGTLPRNAVCVTFDDGYADNITQALPVLKKYAIPASIFVATGFLNGGRMWNDTVIESVRNTNRLDLSHVGLGVLDLSTYTQKLTAIDSLLKQLKYQPLEQREKMVACIEQQVQYELPSDLMMTTEQLRFAAKVGIEIGAHTVNHPILTELSSDKARQEIEQSKVELEHYLGKPVRFFAYPNGKRGVDYHQQHRDVVEELGFSAAVTTDWGATSNTSDYFQLCRFTPWYKTPVKFFLRLLLNQRKVG